MVISSSVSQKEPGTLKNTCLIALLLFMVSACSSDSSGGNPNRNPEVGSGILLEVDQAVGAHGQGAGPRHGNRYPDELAQGGQAVGGQQHANVGQGQGKDSVLEAHRP